LKEGEKRITVLDLLENRDTASTIDSFYEDVFLERIYETDKQILYPISQQIIDWFTSSVHAKVVRERESRVG